jgi:O-antigen/teichoic acid export membrane protein
MTAMSLVPMHMHNVLYFILPRADIESRRLHVHQTLLYLCCAGLLGGLAVSPLNPWLPERMHALSSFGVLVPALTALFSASLLIDVLPTVEERTSWQASFTVGLSLLRTVMIGGAAFLTGDLLVVVWLLLAVMGVKLLVLLAYIAKVHSLRGPWFQRSAFVAQLRHACPLGGAAALYGLRGQADQWIAASLFALTNFASFSVAAVFGAMVNMARQSVNNVVVPSMSRFQAAGDVLGMVGLNRRANVTVATLAYPLLAFAFVFAEELITLIYTNTYAAAAPVMRVYLCGMAVLVIELSSILLLLRDGVFSLRLSALLLAGSVGISWLAAQRYGLAGAAVGSTLALFADRFATLQRIATSTGVPVRRLQDWLALLRLLGCAIAAGSATWAAAVAWFDDFSILPRLLSGMAVMAAVYGALLALINGFLAQQEPGPTSPT